jgi:hypothetical protein
MDSVDERPPGGGAFLRELVDHILDEVCSLWIGCADLEVPGLDLGMETDLPASPHEYNVFVISCVGRAPMRAAPLHRDEVLGEPLLNQLDEGRRV